MVASFSSTESKKVSSNIAGIIVKITYPKLSRNRIASERFHWFDIMSSSRRFASRSDIRMSIFRVLSLGILCGDFLVRLFGDPHYHRIQVFCYLIELFWMIHLYL